MTSKPLSLRSPLQNPRHVRGNCCRVQVAAGHLQYRQMAYRTRPIVRLEVMNRMVTKGYRKGVYERVTSGTRGGERAQAFSEAYLWG